MKHYVINLDRAPERLAETARLFEGAGLAFERVPAVDARAMSREELRKACRPVRFYLANARRVRTGEIACALSHRKAWRAAFADGAPAAAVFEDDVAFDAEGLREHLAAAERENDPAVPTVWLLHEGLPRPAADPPGRWYGLREARGDVGRSWCTHAYALNAAAARRLEALLSPMATPCDAWSTFARCGVRVLVADVKAVCLHRFGGIVSASTDNLVLSAALGLVAVAAYGNYFYVVTSVVAFVYAIHSSMTAGFGNKIHVEGRAATLGSFLLANRLVLAAVAWCAAMMLALYQPFVRVWTRDDPALVRHAATPLLMALYFYADQSRQLLLSLKGAAALWRGDRWKPLVSGLANLSLSVALALLLPEPWKLDGVIGATLLCVVAIEIPWEARAVFGPFFGKGAAPGYWRQQAHFALLAAGLSALAWGGARAVPLAGFAGLLAKAAAAAAFSGAAILALFRRDLAAARVRKSGARRVS